MSSVRPFSLLAASLLTSTVLGCSGALTATPAPSAAVLTGNWQISSSSTSAAKLASLAGEFTGGGATVTGIVHASAANACIATGTAIDLSGSVSSASLLTLTGTVVGGTLTITGTVAADGKSLSGATYVVTGGTCAFATPATANAASYASITGTYTGTFPDMSGQSSSITATLTQSPSSSTTGTFSLSGSATLPSNPCFNSPVAITNSQVSGGSFNLTYSDSSTGNSVNALGTFTTDGKTLTVTQWTLTGSCGPDSGTGVLMKQ